MNQIEILSPPQAVSLTDEWFQFATADHFWMQRRHRVLKRVIKRVRSPIRRALEIGCGNGVARDMLERDFDFAVDGCDLNRMALEMAKPGKGRLFVYDILDQVPSLLGRYDAVFLLDVIEHIPDDAAFLIAASRDRKSSHLALGPVIGSFIACAQGDSSVERIRRRRKRYSDVALCPPMSSSGSIVTRNEKH